jgi:protein-S-isoprenylcysteine O-methyltransferase Ste14
MGSVSIVFVLVRAVTYATAFIGLVLVFLPARLLSRSGAASPPAVGVVEAAGMVAATIGAAVTVWCILTFALVGRGTPAPFDPPRDLVVRGPYKYVRNPMYLGAATALAGAALFYRSPALGLYAAAFLVAMHAFVLSYEEPSLRATFGPHYERYCRQVRRWWPKVPAGEAS